MIIRLALSLCAAAVAVALSGPVWSADKPATKTPAKATPKKPAKAASKKPAARSAGKTSAKTVKTSLKREAAPPRVLLGKTETLTCRNGTEDRHARIGVVLIGGKVDSFAYYSKWKPRTCSIYLLRNRDTHSRWVDKGPVTHVGTEKGQFQIEHGKGEYRFVFRDVDRERYCGMDGVINGTLTIRKGSEVCQLTGVMEEGVPLGQAYAYLDQAAPAVEAAAAPVVAPAPAAPAASGLFARRATRESQSAFPASAGGISD